MDISLTVSPIRNGMGQVIGASKVARDITERQQAEQTLREGEERFHHVADEAEAANRAKDMFLATLSHEMRTPLSAIVGWMHILQGGTEGGCSDEELNEGLDVIERNARTMVQLHGRRAGRVAHRFRQGAPGESSLRVERGHPCGHRRGALGGAGQGHRAHVPSSIRPPAPRRAMRRGCSRSSGTCVSNAVKFTPKGGKVHVTLAREQADVRIQVSDSGQGIGPELLPYVFDRFRQADSSTRRRFGGLGLGLSIVKHLVELHGGTVQATARERDAGSTFTVLLPIRAVRIDDSGDDSEAMNPSYPPRRDCRSSGWTLCACWWWTMNPMPAGCSSRCSGSGGCRHGGGQRRGSHRGAGASRIPKCWSATWGCPMRTAST